MGSLLDIAYNGEYGGETTVQSSLNLIYLLAYSPKPGEFLIFGASDERYHIAGGNEQLPHAVHDYLVSNALPNPLGSSPAVKNCSLTAITGSPRGPYTLTFTGPGAPAAPVVADRVILALPFSILRNLSYDGNSLGFSAQKQNAIASLGYGTNSKLQLQFDSRLWNRSGPWGISTGYTFSDTGYQNTWDVTRAQDGQTGILNNYTGGNYGDSFSNPNGASVYATRFLKQIEPVFPGITRLWNGRATIDYPAGNPYLLGSYSFWRVGQYTAFSGAERERAGKCHFAGEHCSINFQGYMEGGAQEGGRAANEILADYKAGAYP
jgi:monoamine oxidase